MAAGAVQRGGPYRFGAAGNLGAKAVCGVASGASGGRDIEWGGHKRVFAGAVVCAAVGRVAEDGEAGDGGGGCGQVSEGAGGMREGLVFSEEGNRARRTGVVL